ncbi:hypothetical protein ACHAWU_000580 [Discostella pseudostelligera]|uniref:Uncharacterized protein n=1 Tax=Discostella pseudostelligera TaxID=259834 RepID=A0ABD3M8L2_9STRA
MRYRLILFVVSAAVLTPVLAFQSRLSLTSRSRHRHPSSHVYRFKDNCVDHHRCGYSNSISHNPYGILNWSRSYASRSNDHAIAGSERHPAQILPIALSILTLVETGRLDDAIQELRGCINGTEIPSSIYHAVIEACCAGGFEPSSNYKRQPKKFNDSKNNRGDGVDRIEVASELLHAMKEQNKVTTHVYEIIISGYARRGRLEDAYRMLTEMEETYQGASHQHDNAEQRNTLEETPTKGNPISLNVYQTVLTSMAKANQYHHVNSLLTKMRRQGVRPNVYTYNALLKICASDDATPRWKEGLSFLSQCQREPGVTPDLITYTTAMKVCARGKQADKAMELFRAVKDMGELELDVYFYTTAMDACAKSGKWRRALSLLDEMKEERGILPNVVTYGVAIAACGNGGQWEKALELLDQMRGDNLSINTITYNSAIAALSKAARTESKTKQSSGVGDASSDGMDALWQKALHLIQCMEKEGVKRDSFTYSSAISTCGAAGRWEEAVQLIQSMKREGGTRPNRVAYTSAITACANSRQWEPAYELFQAMKNDGHIPDLVAYNALIGAGMNSNKPLEVYELWEEMCRSSGMGSSRSVDGDGEVRKGIYPDIVTLTEVIATLDRSPGNTKLNRQRVDTVFSEAVNRGLILRHDSLDTSWEMDLSGMSFPVARAACRFIFRRLVERRQRRGTEDDAREEEVDEVKDLSLITGAGRMREYIREVLRDELVPSVYCVVPKLEQGTLVVKRQVLINYIDGQK